MKDIEKRELIFINGGFIPIPPWVAGGLWCAIAFVVIKNWPDIKAGIIDGWTDAMKEG